MIDSPSDTIPSPSKHSYVILEMEQPEGFQRAANSLLNDGYHAQGGISISVYTDQLGAVATVYVQAFIKFPKIKS